MYDIRSGAAIFVDNWSGTKVRGFLAYNDLCDAPDTGFVVYMHRLDGARVHIGGRTQESRDGGLALGQDITNLELHNDIIFFIDYSHLGGSYNPVHQDLDDNLFVVIHAGEYRTNANDLVVDPRFANVPLSGNTHDHRGTNLMLDDFTPSAGEAIDTGTGLGGVPDFDFAGTARAQRGSAGTRGLRSSPTATPPCGWPTLEPWAMLERDGS
ncbi:MAG: hypothetical protein JRE81_16575 [Deltaproteobacteria bacterium]|nr:hypothetical protein [Deltaproteobacteria bacterium]